MPNRNQRYEVFKHCKDEIETLFNKWVLQSSTGKFFKDNFGLVFNENITEGGSAYAFFSAKWENRTFDIDSCGKSMSETGAKMEIRQSILGYVSITLYPANTKFSRQIEDFVIVRHRLDPSFLCKKWVIYFLWRIFLAYSSTTSIDTTPSLFSRILVGLLRYTRPKCVNGIITESSFWHHVQWMFALAFTMVTSSLFVYYLQTKDIENATSIQTSFYHKMDSIVTETNTSINQEKEVINEKLDSIVLYLKKFSIEKQNMNNNKKR
jgi:hypothetical protein